MTPRPNKQLQPIQSLFRKLLPQEFRHKRSQIEQYQQFFAGQQQDAVFQLVRVLNVTTQYLHVSLPNPALATAKIIFSNLYLDIYNASQTG